MNPFEIYEEETATAKPEAKKEKAEKIKFEDIAASFLMDMAKSEKEKLKLRYYGGNFLSYTGTHYEPAQQVPELLRQYLIQKKVPQNNNIIGNVVPIIGTMVLARLDRHPELPFWTVENPPIKRENVLAFKNGLVNVEEAIAGEAELMPHTAAWVSLQSLGHNYNTSAKCPRWNEFLRQTFEGDQQRIDLLQEWFGYLMLPDNSHQKIMAMTGVSRAGKGTICRVMEEFLGRSNVTGFSLDSLSNQFGLGGLLGKLVALVGEVNLQGNPRKYAIYQTLNMITGNDPVEVEYKYNPLKVSTRLPVRFCINCNGMPNFSDDSGALAERLLILNFDRALKEDERDPALSEKLIEEIDGITIWALEGLARLRQTNKFTIPDKMNESLNDYRRSNSRTLAFIQDKVIIHSSLDTGNMPGVKFVDEDPGFTFCDDLIKHFADWGKENSFYDFNALFLGQNLKKVFPKMKRKQVTDGSQRRWAYQGIKLKSMIEFDL